jgi:hypothetical protein
MTVAIAFFPGAYGTYLEWCLTTLTSSGEIIAPFSTNGSSHNFVGNRLTGFPDWKKFVESKQSTDFVSLHPKIDSQESLSNNLNYICDTAQSMIYLYPDKNSILLCINNWYHKVYKDWWSTVVSNHENLYKDWPVDQHTNPENIPLWIRREFLSFYMMPMWTDTVEWCHTDCWQHDKGCVITVPELLYDFEKTLQRIESFCRLKYIKPIAHLIPLHTENLKRQQHLNEDTLCAQIINSTIEQKEFSWNALSLVSESWIQWQLRNLGYEIECHELDIFPTDSVHLREILYKP